MSEIETTAVIDGNHRVVIVNHGVPAPFNVTIAGQLYRQSGNVVLVADDFEHLDQPRAIVMWRGEEYPTADQAMIAYNTWLMAG